jgi:hypothetical protein
LTFLSAEPLARSCPSKWTLTTPSVWPWSVEMHSPVCQFQILMVSISESATVSVAVAQGQHTV